MTLKLSQKCITWALLLIVAQAQWGGGGGGGSSGGDYGGYGDFKDDLAELKFLMVVGAVLFVIWMIKQCCIEATFHDEMIQFQAKFAEIPSNIDEPQKIDMLKAFARKTYKMDIIVNNLTQRYLCTLKPVVLQKRTLQDQDYRVEMEGEDEIGKSRLQGRLLFTGEGMAVKFSKIYADREKAGQTNSFSNLFYEGTGNSKKMKGSWAFLGHEKEQNWSGTWSMVQA